MSLFAHRAGSTLSLWSPVVLQMAVIFTASSIPNLGPLPGHISDKAAHALGYGILGAALLRAFARGRLDGVTWGRGAAAILTALLYGLSDEFHQRFVPGRSSDLLDVAADVAGACLAVVLAGAAVGARRWGILRGLGARGTGQ